MRDPQERLSELIRKLRDQGHRLTPQRRAVLSILVANGNHPSAEQIHDRVKQDFPMTSLATVYSTLGLLKEMGELLELNFCDDRNHYDCIQPYPHPHLICLNCKTVADLEIEAIDWAPEEVARRTGYRIINYRFDFFGTCPACQEEES